MRSCVGFPSTVNTYTQFGAGVVEEEERKERNVYTEVADVAVLLKHLGDFSSLII